jgi:hypothetical protein
MERGIILREYIVSLCYFALGEVIASCVVLYSGINWCFVVYSGSRQPELGLKNLCKYSGRENPGSKRCLRAVTYLCKLCHVRRERALGWLIY